jgi:hypothetical protein
VASRAYRFDEEKEKRNINYEKIIQIALELPKLDIGSNIRLNCQIGLTRSANNISIKYCIFFV